MNQVNVASTLAIFSLVCLVITQVYSEGTRVIDHRAARSSLHFAHLYMETNVTSFLDFLYPQSKLPFVSLILTCRKWSLVSTEHSHVTDVGFVAQFRLKMDFITLVSFTYNQ